MSTPKQIDFANEEFDDNSPPTSFRLVRKRRSKHNDSDSFASTKKTKRKKSMIWDEEDEIALLKGLVDYLSKTETESTVDWDAFFDFVGDFIVAKVSKDQVMSRLRKFKRKFLSDLERINGGEEPDFTKSSDSQTFGYAMMIWGNNDDAVAKDNVEQIKNSEENEEVPNDEPLVEKKDQQEEDVVDKIVKNVEQIKNCEENKNEEVPNAELLVEKKDQEEEDVVDKVVENVINGIVSNEDNTHVNELCVVNETYKENEEDVNFEPLVAENDFNGSLQQEEVVVDKVAEDVNVEIVRNEEDGTHGDVTSKEVVMADPLDENELKKTDLDVKQTEVAVVEKIPENVIDEKEADINDDDDEDDDELCAVQDAFETMIWQGLSDFQKKLQLEKVANIGAEKRRELSNEWKAICDEARELNIKKLRFAAKLGEALTK